MPKLTVQLSESELNVAEFAVLKLIAVYQAKVEEALEPRPQMIECIATLKLAQKALRNAR
jgi:hypothetical protein